MTVGQHRRCNRLLLGCYDDRHGSGPLLTRMDMHIIPAVKPESNPETDTQDVASRAERSLGFLVHDLK